MSENLLTKSEAIREVVKLNHEISHDLQAILFLVVGTNQIIGESHELLSQQIDNLIKKYSRFREFSYDIFEVNPELEMEAERNIIQQFLQ